MMGEKSKDCHSEGFKNRYGPIPMIRLFETGVRSSRLNGPLLRGRFKEGLPKNIGKPKNGRRLGKPGKPKNGLP